MLEYLRPDVLNPPAIVQAAFDEKRALAEIKEQIERRDEGRAEYKDSILRIGATFIAARRAMRGPMVGGSEKYSPAFLQFVAATGLTPGSAGNYMGYARNPSRLEYKRRNDAKRPGAAPARRQALQEIVKALDNGHSVEDVIAAIRKEVNESK